MNLDQLCPGRHPGARLVAAALESAGVTHTFGIPGTHNIELYDALADSAITPVLVTDEQSAGFIADGMARSGGPLACASVVPGAGLTHVLSGIGEAYMDHVPLLLLLCGVRRDVGYAWQLHDVDQEAIVRPLVKAYFRPASGSEIPAAILQAAELARAGCPGPVAVEIPAELYLQAHRWQPGQDRPQPAPAAPVCSEADLNRAAELLGRSRRPLLHVGLGAAAIPALILALAERLGALVSTTFSAKGVFPEDHPLWLWPGFGQACPQQLRRLAAEADAILILGARMGEVSTASYGLSLPSVSIQVDIDPAVPGRNFPVSCAIGADLAEFVPRLLQRLPAAGARAELCSRLAQAHRAVRAEQLRPGDREKIGPGQLIATVQGQFPASTIYVSDSGNGTFLAVEHLRLKQPRSLLAPTDFSCMGYCIPAAIGAALAHPERPVVGFAGDGALLMTGLELLTASQLGLALTIFVLRDRALGQIAAFQQTLTNRSPCSDLPDYRLAALAEAVGADFLSLAQPERLEAVVAQAWQQRERRHPLLVEVSIDYSHRTYFTRGVVRTNFHRLDWGDRLRMIGRAVGRRLPTG